MKKTVKLIIKKDDERKIELGQILYDYRLRKLIKVDTKNAKWMKDAIIEGHPPNVVSVSLFLTFNDPIMKGDSYFNKNNELKTCVGGETNKDMKECRKIAAFPHQIPTDEVSLRKLTQILNSGGEFEIEMEDEFSNPKAFENVGWGDGLPRPIFINDMVRIT